jgi:dTDP-4-amino-4,6-dideoxygalactose transaminase
MSLNEWPYYDQEMIDISSEILKSGKVNYWTGNFCKEFEKAFAKKFEQKYAVSLMNGSVALTAAYMALDLKENDEVITTPRTFIATTSAMQLLNIKPVFVDICRNSGNIKADYIEKAINTKTKAIAVVHIGGWPADMPSICRLAKKYNLKVLEDCSQAHGAKINNKSVGSFGDISTWSFCQDKIITTGGEGGMVSTNNLKLMDKIWSYKDHGKTREAVYEKTHGPGFRWLHERIGTNLRMTEIQAGIGKIQIDRLNQWIDLRNRNALILYDYLKDIPCIRIPMPDKNIQSAWYKFYVYLEFQKLNLGWDRNRIIRELNQKNFPAFYGSCSEIYMEKGLKNYKISGNKKRLKNAEELGKTSLMFLVHPTITYEQITNYAKNIRIILTNASK